MAKKNVIKSSLIPSRSPLIGLMVIWLAMDKFNATEFAYGFFWAFAALVVIGWFYNKYQEQEVNVSELP